MRLVQKPAVVAVDGGDLEQVVCVFNRQPFVEFVECGQFLGDDRPDHTRDVGVFDQFDAVGFVTEVYFDTAPDSEKPTCISSTSRRR